MKNHLRLDTLTCAFFFAQSISLLAQGPLTPPPGPPAPTMKSLDQIEPRTAINATNTPGDTDSLYKITAPGSYYLTGNITGVANKYGIEITASGVTLDLNGFDLVGVPGMGFYDGVSATGADQRNIAVVNGSIRSWGGDGVDLGTNFAANCRVESILASDNLGSGIITGVSGKVSNCSAFNNTGTGASGIFTGGGSIITNCSANQNNLFGIFTDFSSTMTNCVAYGNGSHGFNTTSGSTITNCTSVSNAGHGIFVIEGCTIALSSARTNTQSGIRAGSGTTVADCTARANTQDGIQCQDSCIIRGNTCDGNGNGTGVGAGVHATGFNNRIEGNHCTLADRGIDVDTISNLIIKNTCKANFINWEVAASNVILVVDATFAGAVNGDSGGLSPGSTDPNANFSF